MKDHYLLIFQKELIHPSKFSLLDVLILIELIPRYPSYQKHLLHCGNFHISSRPTSFYKLFLAQGYEAGYDGGAKWMQLFQVQSTLSIITVFFCLGWNCGYSGWSRTTFMMILSSTFSGKKSLLIRHRKGFKYRQEFWNFTWKMTQKHVFSVPLKFLSTTGKKS